MTITPAQEIKEYIIAKFGEKAFNLFVNAVIQSQEIKIPITIKGDHEETSSQDTEISI